jgi:hypothetical protein
MKNISINTKVSLPIEDVVLTLESELFASVGLHPDSFIEDGKLCIMEDRLDNPNYSAYYFPDGSPNKMIIKKVLSDTPTEDQIRIINSCKEIRSIVQHFINKGE